MFKRNHAAREPKIDREYVSEFTEFMDRFLKEHPEVARDQQLGRSLYWDRKVDFKSLDEAAGDIVPDDNYGFAYWSWSGNDAADPLRRKH